MNADGSIAGVQYTGDRSNVTIAYADGTEREEALEWGTLGQALAMAVGNGMTAQEMYNVMLASGLRFDNENALWFAMSNRAIFCPHQEAIRRQQQVDLVQGINEPPVIENQIPDTIERPFVGNPITDRYGNAFADSFMPDRENTVMERLLCQHDEAFRNPDGSRHGISRGGCNFFTVAAFAQMVAGQSLSSDQILNIWNTVEDRVMSTTYGTYGYVRRSNELADIALTALGRNDIGLRFYNHEGRSQYPNAIFIGYRMGMPTPHFVVGNTAREMIWNPGNTNVPVNRFDRVYLTRR